MTDRETMQQALEALIDAANVLSAPMFSDAADALREALEKSEPPPEWEGINNIIAEYGLQAIDFVSDWKAAQRQWVGLTEFQFAEIYNKWNDTNGSTPWGLNQALEAKLRKLNK